MNPSSVKLRELQTDLARNKDDMDVGLVADMIFDKLYHKDLKSGEVSGIVSDFGNKAENNLSKNPCHHDAYTVVKGELR